MKNAIQHAIPRPVYLPALDADMLATWLCLYTIRAW